MSSKAAWARQQDLVSDEKKGGVGEGGVLQRSKKEEDRAETKALSTGR